MWLMNGHYRYEYFQNDTDGVIADCLQQPSFSL